MPSEEHVPAVGQTGTNTDGTERSATSEDCDEHSAREAVIVYEDGTAWCEECHVANVDAGDATGWSP